MNPLTPVKIDGDASKACRMNSEKKMAEEAQQFEKGGNKEEYMQLIGEGKNVDCNECTYIGWVGTASELVMFSLVEGFAADQAHPLINDKTHLVGSSFKAHKQHTNVFQILYVAEGVVNKME